MKRTVPSNQIEFLYLELLFMASDSTRPSWPNNFTLDKNIKTFQSDFFIKIEIQKQNRIKLVQKAKRFIRF